MPLERNGIPSLQDDYPPGVTLDSLRVRSSCLTCRHRRLGTLSCAAYHDIIPLEIARGRHAHLTPYPGDHGIRFEPTGSL